MVSNTKWPLDRLLRVREEEVLTQRETDLGPLDATLARHAEGEIPSDVEARIALHLRFFERELAALEVQPSARVMGS